LKWIKFLNVRPEIIKPLEENREEMLQNSDNKEFLDKTT
jgi:hypothetical protein